jgi:hypothetical protein
MGLLFILLGVCIIATVFFAFARPRVSSGRDTFTGPPDIISRDDKDPYAQTIWAAFDSGDIVTYHVGDKHMKVVDKATGTSKEAKLAK